MKKGDKYIGRDFGTKATVTGTYKDGAIAMVTYKTSMSTVSTSIIDFKARYKQIRKKGAGRKKGIPTTPITFRVKKADAGKLKKLISVLLSKDSISLKKVYESASTIRHTVKLAADIKAGKY